MNVFGVNALEGSRYNMVWRRDLSSLVIALDCCGVHVSVELEALCADYESEGRTFESFRARHLSLCSLDFFGVRWPRYRVLP
jgi:hypothetical protein